MTENADLSKYGLTEIKPQSKDIQMIYSGSKQSNNNDYTFWPFGELRTPQQDKGLFDKNIVDQLINVAAGGVGGIGMKAPIFGSQYALGKPIVQHLENIGLGIEKAYPKIAKMIGLAENPLAGSMMGGAMNPQDPVFGAMIGAGLGTLPHAIPAAWRGTKQAVNALRPSNLFRGTQTPEQLQNALRVTEGTETPIGDVLQSPTLKNIYENVIARVPFSGAIESMQKTGQQIVQKGHDIMSKLLGSHSPQNVEGELFDTLKQANKFHRELKTGLYKIPDKIADDIKLKLDLPNFSRLANQYIDAIENTNILQTEPQFKSLLNKLRNYQQPVKEIKSNIVSKEGKPLISQVKYPTLKEANILSSHLDDISERYLASSNTAERNLGNVFKQLSQALKGDVKTAVNGSGNEELISSFDIAEKNYAKNYSPFLEREIYKFAQGKADPDMIVQAFIKTGKTTDRANLLEKFTSKLPENKRKLLGYAFLKRAFNEKGEVDPLAFKQLLSPKNLGPRQFDLLFPGKLGKELRDYASLIEKNPEAFQLMRNPKTGARLSDIATVVSGIAAPFTTAGAIIASKGINKLMTSPTVRKKLINKMLEKE